MVILYDDSCGLCNRFVNFVLKRDKRKVFQFASLESHYGTELASIFRLSDDKPGTILLYEDKKVFSQSDAVIKILDALGGIWSYFVILIVFPDSMRNKFYKTIAVHRYRISGRKRYSYPSDILQERFINENSFSF
jgi:predicted DCC family thiol-disulfide oxidoreductase YuxK